MAADYEAMEPALKPGVAGAMRFDGDAVLRPDRYVDELARAGARDAAARSSSTARSRPSIAGRDGVACARARGTLQGARRRVRDWARGRRGWPRRSAFRHCAARCSRARATRSPIRRRRSCRSVRSCCANARVCVTAWGSGFRLGSTMEFSGYDDTPQRAPPGRARTRRRRIPAPNPSARRCARSGTAGGRCASTTCR